MSTKIYSQLLCDIQSFNTKASVVSSHSVFVVIFNAKLCILVCTYYTHIQIYCYIYILLDVIVFACLQHC